MRGLVADMQHIYDTMLKQYCIISTIATVLNIFHPLPSKEYKIGGMRTILMNSSAVYSSG